MEEKKKVDNLKLLKYILLGLVALQVVVIAATLLSGRGSGSGGGDSSSSSVVPFWLIIMIPIILSRKNKSKNFQSKNFLWLLVVLAAFVLLGMTVFLLKVNS